MITSGDGNIVIEKSATGRRLAQVINDKKDNRSQVS